MAQNAMLEKGPVRKDEITATLMQENSVKDEDDVILQLDDKTGIEDQDPYDTFMRRHLQHYGYFTGRNTSYRDNFDGLENWHKNYDLRLSGTQNLSVDEEQLKKMGHFNAHKNGQVDQGLGQFFAEGQPPDELLSRTTQLVFHYQAGKKIPKLREPRNLYALTKEPGPQQATRWPSHMQVVSSPIHFIEYTPTVPDPFYIPTGKEQTPAVRGTPSGEIVYLNDPGRDVYFMRSRVAGCRLAMRDISLTPRDTVDQGNFTLEFESRFESGNLLKAVKINDFDYELTLRPDLYTDKHTQWYFFRVRNMVPGKTYRLTIVNLMKPASLYNNGMKPLFYSEIDAKNNKIGWTRAGSDIKYYRNNLGSMAGRTFYSLTWTIQFPNKDDTCYFAHCYPYTYTDLQEYLLTLANDPVRSRFCKQRVLCRTLAGNLVYILTVTSPSRNPELARSKKAVVLTARVHPGETNASWMMKGFLDFLSGNSSDAKLLRDNFIFKIVPMLNPDGVIVGNYRCSLTGRDLNRNYKSVLKDSFPSVYHTKMMIKRLNMEREIILYCDLHGHSRKNNIFIYGCENKNIPQKKLKERVFPLMLAKNSDTKFSYESCKFKVQKSKEGTGRVVMWYMGIMNSYTMEATFGGTTLGSRKGTHFSARDLEEMGHNFCDTLLDYCDPDNSKYEACFQEIQDRLRRQILKKMQMKNVSGSLGDVDIDDYSSEYESDTSGSDSSCDDGLPVHLLAIAPKLQRKRRLKSRRDRNKQVSRKSAPVQEDPKPMPSHGTKPVTEKPPKPIRYTQTAGNKRRDDHNASVSVGTIAPATGFHIDENARPTKKSDYLEALTTAYIRSGVLMVPDKKNAVSDYSMRYTNGAGKNDSNKNVQYLASQLGDLTAEEQYEIMRRSAMRRQLTSAQQRILAQRHLAAVAQMQQRQEQASSASNRPLHSASKHRRNSGTPLKQHPNPFEADSSAQLSSSRANSRCPSATWKQETIRKVEMAQPSNYPASLETSTCAAPEENFLTSNKSSVPATDSTASNKKNTSIPLSIQAISKDENVVADEEVMQTVASIVNKTIEQQSIKIPSHMNVDSTDISIAKPMQNSFSNEESNGSSSHISTVDNTNKGNVRKGNSVLLFGSADEDFLNKLAPENTKVSKAFDPIKRQQIFEESPIGPQNVLGKGVREESPTEAKTVRSNPVFGEALDPLPQKNTNNTSEVEPQSVMPSNKQRVRYRPSSRVSILTDDPLNPTEISLENIPQQWGGTKSNVLLDVGRERTPEPGKWERSRTLSAKKSALSTVYAEGHNSRVRVKIYQGNGESESFFGMSDSVGPNNFKHGERVPAVVANITELRRTLMGQGRDGKDEDTKGTATPTKTRNQANSDAEKGLPPNKRRSVNLRPRAHSRFQDAPNQENCKSPIVNGGETFKHNSDYVESDRTAKEISPAYEDNVFKTLDDMTKIKNNKRGRRHIPPTLRNTDYAVPRIRHSSGEIEDIAEEKWPTTNEIELRRYSQGNATIEKLGDHSLTSIRFGSRTNEHSKRLREQWIDVHQRQVVSTVTPRHDMLAMSSVSLNIEGEIDEKSYVTTPALAKRPVPPLLRYLSAKQTTKKKS